MGIKMKEKTKVGEIVLGNWAIVGNPCHTKAKNYKKIAKFLAVFKKNRRI